MKRLVSEIGIHLMIVIGAVLAIILPYIRKTILDKVEAFDWKYFYHLLLAAIWTNALAFIVIAESNWELPSGIFPDIAILVFALAYGFGGIGGQKIAIQYYRLIKPLETSYR